MDIKLAGYNVDTDILEGFKHALPRAEFTPESISAAYARISRSEKGIHDLRIDSRKDIEKARKSNTQIVYEYNHQSIAEHTVFNFDIIGISRLATEEIQNTRLASFTEKSQRYVKFKDDYIIPNEYKDNVEVTSLLELQFKAYKEIYDILKGLETSEKLTPTEDARYVLPLATKTQFGMTINARNLEHLIKKCNLSDLEEVREIGNKLLAVASEIAPSLIKFVTPSISEIESKKRQSNALSRYRYNDPSTIAKCLDSNHHGVDIILSTGLFKDINDINDFLRNLKIHDRLPREFELIDTTYKLWMSAACYAQFKRHRMTTQIAFPYQSCIYYIPESFKNNEKIMNIFLNIMKNTSQVHKYNKTSYILTNASGREVIAKINLREMYHMMQLRGDRHAQKEIRDLTTKMMELVNIC